MSISDSYLEDLERAFKKNPTRFAVNTSARASGARSPKQVPDVYDTSITIVTAGRKFMDARVRFDAAQMKEWRKQVAAHFPGTWNDALHVRVEFDSMKPNVTILTPVAPHERSSKGVYTLSQKKPHYRAAFTTTWNYLGKEPPVSGRVTAPFKFLKGRIVLTLDELGER